MILCLVDKDIEVVVMLSEELFIVMGKYMEDLVKVGVLLGGEGLYFSLCGVCVEFKYGKLIVIDGLFVEVKELIVGYIML